MKFLFFILFLFEFFVVNAEVAATTNEDFTASTNICSDFSDQDIATIVHSYCSAVTVKTTMVVSRNFSTCKKVGVKNGNSFRLLKACTDKTSNALSYKFCLQNIDARPSDFTPNKIEACTEISKYPAQLAGCLRAVKADTDVTKIKSCKPGLSDKISRFFTNCFK